MSGEDKKKLDSSTADQRDMTEQEEGSDPIGFSISLVANVNISYVAVLHHTSSDFCCGIPATRRWYAFASGKATLRVAVSNIRKPLATK